MVLYPPRNGKDIFDPVIEERLAEPGADKCLIQMTPDQIGRYASQMLFDNRIIVANRKEGREIGPTFQKARFWDLTDMVRYANHMAERDCLNGGPVLDAEYFTPKRACPKIVPMESLTKVLIGYQYNIASEQLEPVMVNATRQ